MHRRAHDEESTEKRGDLIITRGLTVVSRTLGVSGKCDIVEFHQNEAGVYINGWQGKWIPYPVEYKHGKPKLDDCDRSQLCAQAICLEEMLCCHIQEGALYYGQPQRRESVVFTDEMRNEVSCAIAQMHDLISKGYTPTVRLNRQCKSCSLNSVCLPEIAKTKSVNDYIGENI